MGLLWRVAQRTGPTYLSTATVPEWGYSENLAQGADLAAAPVSALGKKVRATLAILKYPRLPSRGTQ